MNNSLWWRRAGTPPTFGSPLAGDDTCDVAIIGAGFTGLWTAYYLRQLAPDLDVRLLEAGQVGFGASGRNGGWCSALFPASLPRIADEYGRSAAIAMQRAMFDTVDEVGTVIEQEGIDCDWARGGTLMMARGAAQVTRAHDHLAEYREFGFDDSDYRWLDADEAAQRVHASDLRGAIYTPHCAAIDPLKLARGLAAAVVNAGARVHEHTRALDGSEGAVRTPGGTLRARNVIRATEAYSTLLPGHRRDVAPVYSLMIATEPLPADVWSSIGLARRETFSDLRHVLIYGQRTADDRFAFGGRGAPYHFGSAIRPGFDHDPRVHEHLRQTLIGLFAGLDDVEITDRWGGVLGIARDWWARVTYDPASGMGSAGGYVGDGVGTTNLAGRTLAHLVAGVDTDLTRLPWVNRPLRRWEPEPLRWIGANAALAAMRVGDAEEARTGRPSRLADAVHHLTGA